MMLVAGLALLTVQLLFGCDFQSRPEVITISNPPPFKPSNPEDIKNYQQAMAIIISACRDDLHLPVVDPVQLFLYKDKASFASYGHGWPTLPFDLAHVDADTQDNKIRLNLEKIQTQPWWRLTNLLAHEYGHVLQYALGGGEPFLARTPHWFREGFADWIAAKVFESIKWRDPGIALHRAELELTHNRDNFSGLHALDYQWGALLNKPKGDIRTYTLALVAVDKLIATKGFLSVLNYIKSGDFNTTFGISLDGFEADFDNYLSNLMLPTTEDAIALQRPDWKIGFQWTYAVKGRGTTVAETKSVVEHSVFDGMAAYGVKIGKLETFYATKNLERLASTQDGRVINKRNDPSQDVSWPLRVGKNWGNRYTWEDSVHKITHSVNYTMVVREIEKTKVTAGIFSAARIEAYDVLSGHLMAEYWYSPATKWYIKTRVYNSIVPVLEEELTSFNIEQAQSNWEDYPS